MTGQSLAMGITGTYMLFHTINIMSMGHARKVKSSKVEDHYAKSFI